MTHRWLLWPRPRRKGKGQWGLSLLLGIALSLFLLHRFDRSLRPQLVALAQTKLQNEITQMTARSVTRCLEQAGLSYADMVTLQLGPDGEISALSTDTVRLNWLRSQVLEDLLSQTDALYSKDLGVPLGALTGIDFLSSVGPELPVKVIAVAGVAGDFRNDFTSAGINQTLHRVMLEVTVTTQLLLPGGIVEETLHTPVCVAETVIVGQVPQTYLNWGA